MASIAFRDPFVGTNIIYLLDTCVHPVSSVADNVNVVAFSCALCLMVDILADLMACMTAQLIAALDCLLCHCAPYQNTNGKL